MSDGILKLLWTIPIILWAIVAIFGGIIKDTITWVKERN